MMKMLAYHTQEKWVLLYTERWLKAGIEQADGSIAARAKGTPQGGVVSPLLANLYLHHAFDMWMGRHFTSNPFERYADDIIVHCHSKEEAEQVLLAIRERLQIFELELHPEKTKLVYCKNNNRKEDHEQNSFTFLSYSFQPRGKQIAFRKGTKTMVFSAAICCKAKAFVRGKIKAVFNPRNTQVSLERTAIKLNPKIRGWLNYYSRFNAKIAGNVFLYLNELIREWMMEKYRLGSRKAVLEKYREYVRSNRDLLVHWQKGIIW
jgi:group II intron reverse transcriptase/maturase